MRTATTFVLVASAAVWGMPSPANSTTQPRLPAAASGQEAAPATAEPVRRPPVEIRGASRTIPPQGDGDKPRTENGGAQGDSGTAGGTGANRSAPSASSLHWVYSFRAPKGRSRGLLNSHVRGCRAAAMAPMSAAIETAAAGAGTKASPSESGAGPRPSPCRIVGTDLRTVAGNDVTGDLIVDLAPDLAQRLASWAAANPWLVDSAHSAPAGNGPTADSSAPIRITLRMVDPRGRLERWSDAVVSNVLRILGLLLIVLFSVLPWLVLAWILLTVWRWATAKGWRGTVAEARLRRRQAERSKQVAEIQRSIDKMNQAVPESPPAQA